MQESAWQGRSRDRQLPRADSGAYSATAGTASAAPVLGGEKDVSGRKKKTMIREEANMRNPMSMHRRAEAKQTSFHWYSPSTRRQPKSWGGRGWWCLPVTNPLRGKIKSMYCPGEIGTHRQHQRNSIVGGLSEENAFNFYGI